MASGNYFGFIAGYSYPEKDTAASLAAQCGGHKLGAKMIGSSYISTGDVNVISWMLASTTDVPEAAMKFLNLTYTDKDVINLLIYGIEGRDYVKNDDGTVSYPKGQDATTVPYTAQLSCGTLGNYFKMYPMDCTNPASLDWELEQNKNAKASPAMGFTFDASKLKTQYTAVGNVIDQYLPGVLCGSVDPDTGIEKFVNALNDAGYQDILKEKQTQLDAWTAKK
jgi:putative aldouronate transport system substrate-binding protein